jgi:hypothetical protein
VLQNASIRQHPNVAKLVGVCWEIDSGAGDIWPVLVFEKASLGDLRKFMDSERGRVMSMQDRIQLCVDVAMGVLALHTSSMSTIVSVCLNHDNLKLKNRYRPWGYKTRKHTYLH